MYKFSVTQFDGEVIGTYDDGTTPVVLKQRATEDFLFDCDCMLDSLALKLEIIKKNKEK